MVVTNVSGGGGGGGWFCGGGGGGDGGASLSKSLYNLQCLKKPLKITMHPEYDVIASVAYCILYIIGRMF